MRSAKLRTGTRAVGPRAAFRTNLSVPARRGTKALRTSLGTTSFGAAGPTTFTPGTARSAWATFPFAATAAELLHPLADELTKLAAFRVIERAIVIAVEMFLERLAQPFAPGRVIRCRRSLLLRRLGRLLAVHGARADKRRAHRQKPKCVKASHGIFSLLD